MQMHHYYVIIGLTDLDKQRQEAIARQNDGRWAGTSIIHHHKHNEPANELCDYGDGKHEVYMVGKSGMTGDKTLVSIVETQTKVEQNVIHGDNGQGYMDSGHVLETPEHSIVTKEWDQ